MAKMVFTGLDGYIAKLEQIRQKKADDATKRALYEGAAVVADDVRAAVDSIPVHVKGDANSGGITEGQKEALAKGLGVAPFQSEGDRIDTLVGFSGYSDYKTKLYPNGQPLALIARVAESGTSFSKKTPFARKAFRKAKPQAEAKMKEVFESEIEKIMKG